jgi:hypothetical protein
MEITLQVFWIVLLIFTIHTITEHIYHRLITKPGMSKSTNGFFLTLGYWVKIIFTIFLLFIILQ